MAIWIAFAVLASLVVALLARPLMRPARARTDGSDNDLAFYHDQIDSVEREREDGLLPAAEAAAARAEIGRRILERARHEAMPRAVPKRENSGLIYGLAGILPAAAAAIYLAYGSPSLPGQPHAARVALPLDKTPVEDLVAKVEARLREAPDEGAGWEAIAPIYMAQGRFADAAQAYTKAVELLGETPERLTGLGESAIRASNGVVTEPARKAYERVLALDASRADARVWIALAKEQDSDFKGAAEEYRAVAADESANPRWRDAARQRLAEIEKNMAPAPKGEDSAQPKEAPAP